MVNASGTTWTAYPTLETSVTFDHPTTVAMITQLSDVTWHDRPMGATIAARINIDHDEIISNPGYTGEAERYRTVQAFWSGTLPAGKHFVKVEYKTTISGRSKPQESDTDGRVLYIIELGCQL